MAERISPFRQIIETLKGFIQTDSFYKLRGQTFAWKLLFSVIVGVLVSFLMYFVRGIRIISGTNIDNLLKNAGHIEYADDSLFCERRYEGQIKNYYFIIDTDVDAWMKPVYDGVTQNEYGTDVTDRLDNDLLYKDDVTDIIMISRTNAVDIKRVGFRYIYLDGKWSELISRFGVNSFTQEDIGSKYRILVLEYAAVWTVLAIPIRMISLFFTALLWSILGIMIKAVKKSMASFATLYWVSFYMQAGFMICSAVLKTIFSYSLGIVSVIIYVIVISRMLRVGLPPDMRNIVYGEDFMRYFSSGAGGWRI